MNGLRAARLAQGKSFRAYCIENNLDFCEYSKLEREGSEPRDLVAKLPAFIPPHIAANPALLDKLIDLIRNS